MGAERIRRLIETGDLQGLRGALASDPELANQSIAWFLNQKNESEPLHYVCDCVFNPRPMRKQDSWLHNLVYVEMRQGHPELRSGRAVR